MDIIEKRKKWDKKVTIQLFFAEMMRITFIPFAIKLIFWAFNRKIVHLPENPKTLPPDDLKQPLTEITESALIYPDGHPIWLPEPVSGYSISNRDIFINRQKDVLDFCRKYTEDCK